MRDAFPWYFPPTEEEYSQLWKSAWLSVDTNVLLGLYRLHPAAQSALLQALEDFSNRAFVTRHVCEEYIRRRHSVVVTASKSFEAFVSELESQFKSLDDKFASTRFLADEFVKQVQEKQRNLMDEVRKQVAELQKGHPDYKDPNKDKILSDILRIFGPVPPGPSSDLLEQRKKEAQRRIDIKQPPGYKDRGKDGENPYGDYLIWAELLDFAKKKKHPVIFVTSDNKEDWWDHGSTGTGGPRPELLREAHEMSGQRFLIYQTDRFVEHAGKLRGKPVSQDVLNEIQDVQEKVRAVPKGPLVNRSARAKVFMALLREASSHCDRRDFDAALNCCRAAIEMRINDRHAKEVYGDCCRRYAEDFYSRKELAPAAEWINRSMAILSSLRESKHHSLQARTVFALSKSQFLACQLFGQPELGQLAYSNAERAFELHGLQKYQDWLLSLRGTSSG